MALRRPQSMGAAQVHVNRLVACRRTAEPRLRRGSPQTVLLTPARSDTPGTVSSERWRENDSLGDQGCRYGALRTGAPESEEAVGLEEQERENPTGPRTGPLHLSPPSPQETWADGGAAAPVWSQADPQTSLQAGGMAHLVLPQPIRPPVSPPPHPHAQCPSPPGPTAHGAQP